MTPLQIQTTERTPWPSTYEVLLGEARALGLHGVLAELERLNQNDKEVEEDEPWGPWSEIVEAQAVTLDVIRLRRGAKPGEALPSSVTPSDSAEADRLSAEATTHLYRAEQLLAQKAQS